MYYLVAGYKPAGSELLAGRYRVVSTAPAVVEDRAPHLPVEPGGPLPAAARPYQRLNLFRWAVPEVHTCLTLPNAAEPCILLERGPIGEDGRPWTTLPMAWSAAGPLRQLGWLIQVVRLWDPCLQEGVGGSLLDPANVGVLGWQACLFQLHLDSATPTLSELGAAWLKCLPGLEPPLLEVVEALAAGLYPGAAVLLDALESLVACIPPSQRVKAHGDTHPGRRSNNEDCFAYEPGGGYAVVCDGMGGHDSGEVASQMALASLRADLAVLTAQPLAPAEVRRGLDAAVRRANQQILEENRRQGRSQLRQMGTTVVACCLTGALLHVAHVGDSRIYLVDRHHCEQITVDDDVANLEVSLARTTTSLVSRLSGSGNLTQALGVVSMNALQVTVQTFVLSEDCLVLLCTDGLCDGNLVERSWRSSLLPLVCGDLPSGGRSLIDLALRELGHDNITFVLLQYTVG
jgi:protein phosphatase